jgi:SAM-dependent methyltransferase
MTSPLAVPGPWDLVASAYADEITPQFEQFTREALRLAELPPASSIVDVAAGPGTLAALAAREGHRVAAIDFSPSMVDRLRARISREGLTGIDARVGDGMALPFEDATFDGGFSMFGLMFFPDRAKGFRELLRVVKPGARVVVSSWVPSERLPLLAATFAALAEVLPPPPNAPEAPPFKPPLAERDECIAEMSAAGFRDVVEHEVVVETTSPSVTAFWELQERAGAPVVLRKSQLGAKWTEVSRAVLERLKARFGDGPQTIQMPAHLTVGRR